MYQCSLFITKKIVNSIKDRKYIIKIPKIFQIIQSQKLPVIKQTNIMITVDLELFAIITEKLQVKLQRMI